MAAGRREPQSVSFCPVLAPGADPSTPGSRLAAQTDLAPEEREGERARWRFLRALRAVRSRVTSLSCGAGRALCVTPAAPAGPAPVCGDTATPELSSPFCCPPEPPLVSPAGSGPVPGQVPAGVEAQRSPSPRCPRWARVCESRSLRTGVLGGINASPIDSDGHRS